jgi:hypothetical protein
MLEQCSPTAPDDHTKHLAEFDHPAERNTEVKHNVTILEEINSNNSIQADEKITSMLSRSH